MRTGIAGAGAVGCHYGSLLQQGGVEVIYLARGDHLKALQQHGLTHISQGETTQLPIEATGDPAALAGCDAVLLACKTTGLAAMCEQLAGLLSPDCVLMTLQNGVEAPAVVGEHFPHHPLLAASAFIGVRIDAPGVINHSAAGHIRLGVWQEHGDRARSVLSKLIDSWRQAGVDAKQSDDMAAMLWHKMLWNCGFNAITALTRRFARDIASEEDSARWVRDAMQEAIGVARAGGIELPQDAIDQHMQLTMQAGEVKTSMWQDLEHGHATEIEAMNGYISLRGRELDIDTPVNDLLASLIRATER